MGSTVRRYGIQRLVCRVGFLGWFGCFGLFEWGLLAARGALVFCHYNLENYGVPDAGTGGGAGAEGSQVSAVGAQENERGIERRDVAPDFRSGRRHRSLEQQRVEQQAALDRVISEIGPDVLGVCEVGTREALEGLRSGLEARGLRFPETEFVEGPDPDRHLALLSRHPIVERHSRGEVVFRMDGRVERVRRGFLDVVLDVGGYRLRLVGVHLKSKLAVEGGEARLRREEARMLRLHLEGILEREPGVNLLCYGDFNEGRNEPGIREVLAAGPGLRDLRLEDAAGERWTHWWRAADVYARLDYILVSPGLWPEVARGGAGIYRGRDWQGASDHRPVYVRLTARETGRE